MAKIVENLDTIIDPFFTDTELDQLAREAGFVQRTSKLNGRLFLDLIVFNSESLKDESLQDLCAVLSDNHGIEIKKQSLHDRFNNNAVMFLKMALEKILKYQIGNDFSFPNLNGINRILIKDSVCFQIDESLSEFYPGSGGSGSNASIRIQFEYDLLSGIIVDLSINAFNDQDATNSVATIELIRNGDLVIRDLAYMNLTVLQILQKKLSFFLCRLSPKVRVFELIGNKYIILNFKKIRLYMKKNGLSLIEKEAYIGEKEKFKVRLIIHLLPDEIVETRLRKARENAKKKGRNDLTQEYIARSQLNLFITNCDNEQIPAEKVWPLYRLRWQIELVFKIFKSICKIDKVKKVKKHRFECYIFSKLTFIVIGWQIIWKIAKHLYVYESKALSFFKAFKMLFRIKMRELRGVIMLKNGSIESFMKEFYKLSRINHLLEKRSQEPSSLEILLGCLTCRHDEEYSLVNLLA